MKRKYQRRSVRCILLAILMSGLALHTAASIPDESGTATQPQGVQTSPSEFTVETEMPYRARLRTTGIFINANHLTKPMEEVVESIKAQDDRPHVAVIICRGNQERPIKDYWDVADEFIFEALFLQPDWNAPPSDTLLWPGYDHPMINYLRKIRNVTYGKHVIVSVPMTSRELWGVPRERPELFDELRWMAMAVIGADYQGMLWGHVRREPQWNEMLRELTAQIEAHASDLGAAEPVGWVKAPDGQPVSALASENKLFITLLNTDYMKVSEDKQRISGALNPGRCRGTLAIDLPAGISADSAATLNDSPVTIERTDKGLICPYDFAAGGEMIVVSFKKSAQPQTPPAPADTQASASGSTSEKTEIITSP